MKSSKVRFLTQSLVWLLYFPASSLGCDTTSPGTDGGPAEADSGPGSDAGDGDAGAGPVCTPGDSRTATCGFCGTEAQECDEGGQWMATSSCLGQGECSEGAVETEDLGMCGERQRICLMGCTWSDWETVRAPGECTPGEMRTSDTACPPSQVRDEVCSDECVWTGTTDCADPCGGVARVAPEWKREVCVPAGNFIRGSMDYPDAQPVAEVYVSSYYIDAYPVTIRRYQECEAAGACIPSPHETYAMADRLDYPVQQVGHAMAEAFCVWDGRRLPTEAEWEKAARGPVPRTARFPWGDTWDCATIQNGDCGFNWPSGQERWAMDPYDGMPSTRSYYGTYEQLSNVFEITADLYDANFYSRPESRTDPLCTTWSAFPNAYSMRGTSRANNQGLSYRSRVGGTGELQGFRCARSAP